MLTVDGFLGELTITSASAELECNGAAQKDNQYVVSYDGTTVAAVPGSNGLKFALPTLTRDTITITPTFGGITTPSQNVPNNNTFTYILQNDAKYLGTRNITYGTIKMYDSLSVSVSATPVTCYGLNNGQASILISGGKKNLSNYVYRLDGGADVSTTGAVNLSNLSNGAHSIYVKDSLNYTKTVSFSITQPAALQLTLTGDHPVCDDGTVMSFVTGGNGGNTFRINELYATTHGVYNNLTVGKQVISVVDSKGCTVKDSVTLVQQNYTAKMGITRFGQIAEY